MAAAEPKKVSPQSVGAASRSVRWKTSKSNVMRANVQLTMAKHILQYIHSLQYYMLPISRPPLSPAISENVRLRCGGT